ncbi:Thylakoid soluble phosphoprotein TSP9 [Carex littledalei]|uniref:Thylakoid soluble phosphoprotein TSP9 n=1 Tax=Carex littledalei TaxID=544730 RepID=A0A833VNK2_9POAL|nr:Thylakoid soluble phosphoprotein TSP9 [Carex littledalei]
MASLGLGFALPAAKAGNGMTSRGRGRKQTTSVVVAPRATKGTTSVGAGPKEEKGLFDWIISGLQKDDQLLETDPILNKVDTVPKSKPATKSPVSAPKTDGGFGGFGGLFAKK